MPFCIIIELQSEKNIVQFSLEFGENVVQLSLKFEKKILCNWVWWTLPCVFCSINAQKKLHKIKKNFENYNFSWKQQLASVAERRRRKRRRRRWRRKWRGWRKWWWLKICNDIRVLQVCIFHFFKFELLLLFVFMSRNPVLRIH